MKFSRMIMEKESPEELGYDQIRYNLSESSIADRRLSELNLGLDDVLLFYGDHSGLPELRERLGAGHYGLAASNILVCAGACMSLFVVNATLLAPGDRILVVQPNYATNIEVPRSLAIGVDLFRLTFEEGYSLDTDRLERAITPETKVISITYPHNPSGAMIDAETLERLVIITEQHGCYLLVDETYRELTFGEKLPTAASLSRRAISVESLSKSYGVPGIRMGWIACQDPVLHERFLATKEQVMICNSVLDEHVALAVLRQKDALLAPVRQSNMKKFLQVKAWMDSQDLLEWVEPSGGVVCFPRFKGEVSIDTDRFYRVLLDEYGTFVGPGRWFEESDRHFRIGYGWPTDADLAAGLSNIIRAAEDSLI